MPASRTTRTTGSIFVLDPDPEHSRNIASLVDGLGYPVREFSSAEQVITVLEDGEVAGCIISEMELPGMSGLELLQKLRARRVGTPVIIVTGDTDVSLAVRAIQSSVADYLAKPLVERQLVNRVRALMHQYETQRRRFQLDRWRSE